MLILRNLRKVTNINLIIYGSIANEICLSGFHSFTEFESIAEAEEETESKAAPEDPISSMCQQLSQELSILSMKDAASKDQDNHNSSTKQVIIVLYLIIGKD